MRGEGRGEGVFTLIKLVAIFSSLLTSSRSCSDDCSDEDVKLSSSDIINASMMPLIPSVTCSLTSSLAAYTTTKIEGLDT